MPKGEAGGGRPIPGPERKRIKAIHETIGALSKTDANIGDLDRKMREQNVRMMDVDSATRKVMANAGPGAKRKGYVTRSTLSQRKPGGSD